MHSDCVSEGLGSAGITGPNAEGCWRISPLGGVRGLRYSGR